MNFFLACFVWILIGAVLGLGIWVMAAKGSVWLLGIAVVAFILAVWRFGCRTH